jgi:hypothetical protein
VARGPAHSPHSGGGKAFLQVWLPCVLCNEFTRNCTCVSLQRWSCLCHDVTLVSENATALHPNLRCHGWRSSASACLTYAQIYTGPTISCWCVGTEIPCFWNGHISPLATALQVEVTHAVGNFLVSEARRNKHSPVRSLHRFAQRDL